jgi:squalene-hopene/tetraprenyl-beta-curcumene cyclase
MRNSLTKVLIATAMLEIGAAVTIAQQKTPEAPVLPEIRADSERAIAKALDYLRSTQDKDGGWTAAYGPAVTAIVAQAFAQDAHYGPENAVVKRALAFVLRHERDDGGIYDKKKPLENYQTSVALMFLSSLPAESQRERIARAQAFLTKLQYDDGEKIPEKDAWYGGAGYNGKKRPDLSNTQMMLEALHQSGLSKDDPVYKRAIVFVSRCQMFGESNDQKFAKGATDGGFIYSPAGGGQSKATEGLVEALGPPRSYGSMTYAGFKSMLYCGLSRDDPRIRACLEWIRSHYTLDENPNLPGKRSAEGLYYYYHVFARALDAWGEPVITDAGGGRHNWRLDLCAKLIALQRPDGSWVNEKDRWLEGDPNYITGLTILSLQTALKDGAQNKSGPPGRE